MSAPRRRCPNCGVLTYGTHTFAECIEALREALMASEDDAKDAHDAAVAEARAQGAAEAFAEAAELLHAASTEQVKAEDDSGAVALAAGAAIMEYKSALAREAAK